MQGKSIGNIETPKKEQEEFKTRQDAFNKELVTLQEKHQLKVVGRLKAFPDGFVAIPVLEDMKNPKKKAS